VDDSKAFGDIARKRRVFACALNLGDIFKAFRPVRISRKPVHDGKKRNPAKHVMGLVRSKACPRFPRLRGVPRHGENPLLAQLIQFRPDQSCRVPGPLFQHEGLLHRRTSCAASAAPANLPPLERRMP
jgi:hypothetical protein